MVYYRIDRVAARRLTASLRDVERQSESIQQLIAEAELLADLATATRLPLDQIAADARTSADQIDAALRIVDGFRVRLHAVFALSPAPDPTQLAPLWDAAPQRRWNQVHQVASHNSYLVPGGVDALFAGGVRSFELDIHRGAPTDFARFPIPGTGPATLVAIAADHLTHDGGRPDDWRVYHSSADSTSEYEYLSDGLAAIVVLDTTDPLTIFVDNKDPFAASHNGPAFDRLLEATLGDRLYGPAELIARAPGAHTVRQAIDQAGWPTVDELEGRILVVVTAELMGYDSAAGRAFVAPAPTFAADSHAVTHVPQDDAIFYNANALTHGSAELIAVQGTGSIVRTYFGPRCEPPMGAAAARANYRATDLSPGEQSCTTTSATRRGREDG